MKKNIGKKLALYPTPATVVGTVGEEGKVNWLRTGDIIGDCAKMGKAYGETLK